MIALLAALLFAEGAHARAPIADNPVVEFRGRVTKVQVVPGTSMPSLLIEQEGGARRVLLGSLRYLMQNGFSPRAGDEVSGKAYRTRDDLVAITVTVTPPGKTLRLRDANGWPLWRGSCHDCRDASPPHHGDAGSARR